MKLCPTEISHSQPWRPLLDYRWKTAGNNAPLEVFSSAKIVLLTTVLETSSIAEMIRVVQIYFSEVYPLIDEFHRQDFKTMYGEMELKTRDKSGHFGK